MRTILPEKWCIKATQDNLQELETYFHSKSDEYDGYNPSWMIQLNNFYYYPQAIKRSWGSNNKIYSLLTDYIEITFEEFERLVLNKEIQYEIQYEIY